jgi:hypothetical protein
MADIIVAGNTSGSITISAPLVAGSGTLTLPTGTDTLIGKATTDILTNKSIAATQLTGTIAAAALPAGSVLQVVMGTTSTIVSSSTNAYADTGLTATITPRSTSSKILVLLAQNGVGKITNNTAVDLRLLRGATQIWTPTDLVGFTSTTAQNRGYSVSASYLDSPSTTSATTYKTQFASYNNNAVAYVQDFGNTTSTSTITLMEIQG